MDLKKIIIEGKNKGIVKLGVELVTQGQVNTPKNSQSNEKCIE